MQEPFLLAALDKAKQGQGLCAPNPCVGAIMVQNNKIIAQAWHHGILGPSVLSMYQDVHAFEKPHTISWYEMGDNMIACLD